jgi:N-acetylneuraminate synthase
MYVGITVETRNKYKSEKDLVNKFTKISNNKKSCSPADIFKKDKPYLIAEIGINHNGDLNIAKKLIVAANACGWDCVKFQKRDPDVCVPQDQKQVRRNTPWGEMSYIEYKHRIEFQQKEYEFIDAYCKQKPIDWSVSVWDLNSLDFAIKFGIPFIKIPSAQFTNKKLIKEIAEKDVFILLSTGMTSWEMIDDTVNMLNQKNSRYALLHCNSTYPAPHHELNLNVIPEMKKRYNCMVGYSGHEYDIEPSVLAVALGAEIVERHITLNHNMWGTDQKSSLEVHAMDSLKKRIDGISKMMGKPEKKICESEKLAMEKLRG